VTSIQGINPVRMWSFGVSSYAYILQNSIMIDFVLNVLAVTLALALLAMIAWPIARMVPCTSSIAVDIIVLLAVAIVFVFIRDYSNIF